MRRSGAVVGLTLIVAMVVGCGERESEGPGKTLTIGMMPKLVGIPYFNACQRGAEEAAKELGVKLVYDGPIVADVSKQAEMLDTWIVRGMDAITVAPNDPHALAPTLRKAQKKGIKVLTWDADSDEDSRHFFVNQATYEAIGFALVDTMAAAIGGKGDVAIITGTLTAANQNKWMEQMRTRIAEKCPGMNIVAVKAPGEDQQQAYQVTKDLLKAQPGLKGIFGITSVALPAAAKAVQDSGMSGKIAVTGLATPQDMATFVKNGTVQTVILWNPVDLGYLTVYAAKKLIEEGTLPEEFAAGRLGTVKRSGTHVLLGPPARFTKENIDQFDF
ncbi:substrate-binding domain-containing protein [bacterium]|nr:substrate-binding domain-containing protein [bacterium]